MPIQIALKAKKADTIELLVQLGAQDPRAQKLKKEKKTAKIFKQSDKNEPKKFVLTRRDPMTN